MRYLAGDLWAIRWTGAARMLAQRAEALGFHAVWLADHIVIPQRVTSSYPYDAGGASPFDPAQPFYEPLSVLNFLAAYTERIRLGMSVLMFLIGSLSTLPKSLRQLTLSGGRLIGGPGAGWMAEEFAALGLTNYAEQGAVTTEYLRLFKELWTKEAPEFYSKCVQVSGIGFVPKPMQRPHPPIWIGSHSDAALRRVALVVTAGCQSVCVRPSLLQAARLLTHI